MRSVEQAAFSLKCIFSIILFCLSFYCRSCKLGRLTLV
ncbi:hypothetical protein D1BOALGB6SA_8682 [Olavius sp. associated proteobacterium Delta 1]|nr:hypothetical protein D1BOALGB6SA_8682 [Olavius sp. associated proteobacterium Delta 1]